MLILVQRPQHKSTSDPVGAPKNNQFGAIFIEFGDTKKCYTFSGLGLVPKSSKKLIGGLSCMHNGQKCIQPFGTIRKKLLLLKSTKNARYARSLGKKTILGHTQRLKSPEIFNWRCKSKRIVTNCCGHVILRQPFTCA